MKDEHKDLTKEERFEIIKNKAEEVEAITEDASGKIVKVQVKFDGVMVQIYPPLELSPASDVDLKSYVDQDDYLVGGFITNIAGKKIRTRNGYIIVDHFLGQKESLDFFNKISCLFNIIGIPITFFHTYDLIALGRTGTRQKIQFATSRMSYAKRSQISLIKLEQDDIGYILLSCFHIWKSIQKNDFLKRTYVYEYLARARLSFFEENLRQAFIFSWIFIETTLKHLWEDMMRTKYKSNNKLNSIIENTRSWTIQIVIEELFLFGIIDEEECETYNKLRKKRNSLFHFSDSKVKREITSVIANEAILSGLKLLDLKLFKKEIQSIPDFKNIREKVLRSMHEMRFK